MPDTEGLDRLIWTDIETTGLNEETDVILEVGFRITDLDGETIDDFDRVIMDSPYYDPKLAGMTEFVMNMHTENNLLSDCENGGFTVAEVEEDLLNWLSGHGVDNEPLCGSSVHFDRGFFVTTMPSVVNKFSYRNIDISTIKELCRRLNPGLYDQMEKVTQPTKSHRVIPDLTDTIGEYKFYLQEFLLDGRPV